MFEMVRALLAAVLMATTAVSAVTPSVDTPVAAEVAPVVAEATRIVQVDLSLNVANKSKEPATDVKIVVPPLVLNQQGSQKVLAVEFSFDPASTRQTSAGVEAVYQFAEVKPGQSYVIKQTYTVELTARATTVVTEKMLEPYLKSVAGFEADAPQIRAQAETVTSGLNDPDAKAEAVMKFVIGHLRYSLTSPSRNKGALAGFLSKDGVCSEYAGLFIAMLRALGVPARPVYGWADSVGLKGALNYQNRHVWAEYYVEGRGWVAVDPTFADVLPAEKIMSFDGFNHVAQDRVQTAISAGYAGEGLLSIITNQMLGEVSARP